MHLAMILHVVDYCIKSASSPLNDLNRLSMEVGEESMNHAAILLNHLINVKYILCPLATSAESIGSNSGIVENVQNVENEKIREIVTYTEMSVSPSFISRKNWCLPINGKYPVQSAIQILNKIQDLGLGTLRDISHPHNSKKSKLLNATTMTLEMMPFLLLRRNLIIHSMFLLSDTTMYQHFFV